MGNGRPSMDQGLTAKEAAARLRKLGPPPETSSRSLASIVAGNVFTLFNAIIGAFFILDLGLGLYADSIFGLIAVINSYIGIRQELNAKKTLDEVAVPGRNVASIFPGPSLATIVTVVNGGLPIATPLLGLERTTSNIFAGPITTSSRSGTENVLGANSPSA